MWVNSAGAVSEVGIIQTSQVEHLARRHDRRAVQPQLGEIDRQPVAGHRVGGGFLAQAVELGRGLLRQPQPPRIPCRG